MTATGWTPALALGHDEIDSQHQELFRRVARLLEAMLNRDRVAVSQLFEFLGMYVVDHFAAEERLMRESDFPGYNVHKAAHERFVRDYHSLRRLHEENGESAGAAVAVKARTWLFEWLRNHIGSTDQLLARHLLRKAG
jgi:hemerythrin-like metal-binding protein